MKSTANILIHKSQFPENIRRDLLKSLRARKINHKFHYDSVKQTQKWLALHQIYSPSRHDENVRTIYDQSFDAAAKEIKSKSVHIIGLGCGGGQKDKRLLKLLKSCGKKIFYTPCDVSAAMVLVARQTALSVLPAQNCFPFVCDLATAKNLPEIFDSRFTIHNSRIVTFFGMIPNFEPRDILPKLSSLIRKEDFLLFSANLAPGKNYADGMKKVLPQYDNALTRDWLLTFLTDLGIEKSDGNLKFEIANGKFGLKRFVVNFHFNRARRVEIENEIFRFKSGEKIRLFFSYRYTPELVRKILARFKLKVGESWLAESGEEGVFLCRRK
ncbi:MAG TPA: L-histidine N(alpha)-methyltransferase [Verrucomicrobiae bacterium]|nr:L-histidine N(alpha)-methyltransferase [Verrucomicrobiae bacterium]